MGSTREATKEAKRKGEGLQLSGRSAYLAYRRSHIQSLVSPVISQVVDDVNDCSLV